MISISKKNNDAILILRFSTTCGKVCISFGDIREKFMKGRKGNKRKKRSPPPNPNERHPFHAGLKFRGKEVCAQRTFDVALGHQQRVGE